MTKTLIALGVTLMLGGCSMAPTTSAELPQGASGKLTWPPRGTCPWRQQFQDPALQTLIGTAPESNRDLRLAALNVEAYEAKYRIQRAAQLPTLAASGSGTRQQGDPTISVVRGRAPSAASTAPTSASPPTRLDLFGRIQSLKDQAP